MGVIDERTLRQTLFAAATYRDSDDPAPEINNYLVINGLLTQDVRADTGQPDAWRDYQQILSELGLIFSTNVMRPITPTALGLSFLDRSVSFSELITLQALRFQYPNGHKLVIDAALHQLLFEATDLHTTSLPALQMSAGMLLRPAVLIWQCLRILQRGGQDPRLSVDEIQRYLMRCSTNADLAVAVAILTRARLGEIVLDRMERGRRNAQDWIKFLLLTPLFDGQAGGNAQIRISTFGLDHDAELDEICDRLADPATFWLPGALDLEDRQGWYEWFGSVDLSVAPIPREQMEEPADSIPAPHDDPAHGAAATSINLRPFDAANLGVANETREGTVHAAYDARMAARQAQLHDLMVVYVARTAATNGALVWDDPDSVDLLIDAHAHEFIVEVKSVTPRNFVVKIRSALGQLLHYDYLRSRESATPRRKIIAVPARVAEGHWVIAFLNDHVDVDLLSLEGGRLVTRSHYEDVRATFRPADDAGMDA